MEKDTKQRFGLWYHESKNGLKYAYGKVIINGTSYKCVLFNNNKKNDKQPDFTLLIQ